MDLKTIINIALAVLALISTFISYYYHVKELIAKSLPGAIDDAEQPDKVAKEKFDEAVAQAMGVIPKVLKPFINKALVEKLVQAAFDKIEAYSKKQAGKK